MFLKREDFVWTIGYDGPAAVVDGQARRRYGSLSAGELADRGLFRAAWASAVYTGSAEEQRLVTEKYNRAAGTSFGEDASLDRLFGVFAVDAKRIVVL